VSAVLTPGIDTGETLRLTVEPFDNPAAAGYQQSFSKNI